MRTRKVIVLPYDEAWKSAFEKESMLGELKKELENSMFDFVRKDICLIIN